MLYQISYILAEVIMYFIIADWLLNISLRKNIKEKIFCSLMLAISIYFIQYLEYRELVHTISCLVWIFIYYCICRNIKKSYIRLFSNAMMTLNLYIVFTVILAIPGSLIYTILQSSITIQQRNQIIVVIQLAFCILFYMVRCKFPIYNLLNFPSRYYQIKTE